MPSLLYSLDYFSRNAIVGSAEEVRTSILHILRSARRNNANRGVTGALVFSDGCFAQVLEGARDDVEAVFESIQCDPRHCEVTILHLRPIEARSFGAWSMAFGGIDGVSIDHGVVENAMGQVESIVATEAGRNLLATLRSVVHRDELDRQKRAGVGEAPLQR
ncbi:MAG: BLUF domain-containing protein [Proteobacteria bacterium]|nr:BLUF domain-containing protein [Burkholderiales bacterium]